MHSMVELTSRKREVISMSNQILSLPMKSDCAQCCGLCCTALYFSKIDGFPNDKEAGTPCVHLQHNFQCNIHSQLEKKGLKGCIGYDCLGAGQQVTQKIYHHLNWQSHPEIREEMFDVFTIVFQLHQMYYYLQEAFTITCSSSIKEKIINLLNENQKVCNGCPTDILVYPIDTYRKQTNSILQLVISQHVKGNKKLPSMLGKSFVHTQFHHYDFSFQLMIAADFEGCSFHECILLGADTRDANFQNADLSTARFLTQHQVNCAKGNLKTKLPAHLDAPVTWK